MRHELAPCAHCHIWHCSACACPRSAPADRLEVLPSPTASAPEPEGLAYRAAA
jgi:hypothetical protein